MKIVAMIPCRLGSQRVSKKNLRLLNGKTLSQWVIDACIESNVFDDIFINSESTLFQKIALDRKVKFYQRPEYLSSNSSSNDDFALDFFNAIECDVLVQVNPTSPFTKSDDLRSFVKMYKEGRYQTLHTVKEEQIEGLYENIPLNFDPMKPMPPSQNLKPVKLFTSSIMAWEKENFRQNMEKSGCAVYDGDGKIGYYTIRGFGTIDIDNEIDFQLAEAIVGIQNKEKEYYEG